MIPSKNYRNLNFNQELLLFLTDFKTKVDNLRIHFNY